MELNIPEIAELREDIRQIHNKIQLLAQKKQETENKVTISFELDEKVPKYIAAKILGCKQKDLFGYVESGLLPEPDSWNRFIVKDLLNLKNNLK